MGLRRLRGPHEGGDRRTRPRLDDLDARRQGPGGRIGRAGRGPARPGPDRGEAAARPRGRRLRRPRPPPPRGRGALAGPRRRRRPRLHHRHGVDRGARLRARPPGDQPLEPDRRPRRQRLTPAHPPHGSLPPLATQEPPLGGAVLWYASAAMSPLLTLIRPTAARYSARAWLTGFALALAADLAVITLGADHARWLTKPALMLLLLGFL